MKYIILIALIGNFALSQAQEYRQTKSKVRFFSEAILEDIEAINTTAKAAIKAKDSSIVVVIPNVGFKFEKALMEEHFNENYMESDEFPYSTFQGKIVEGWDMSSNGEFEVKISGTLNIHGVALERSFKAVLVKKGKNISVSGNFMIHVEDHEIEVPNMYIENIAEDVEVTVEIELSKKNE